MTTKKETNKKIKLSDEENAKIALKIAKKSYKYINTKIAHEIIALKSKGDIISTDDFITLIIRSLAMVNANILRKLMFDNKDNIMSKENFQEIMTYFFKTTADALQGIANAAEKEKMN